MTQRLIFFPDSIDPFLYQLIFASTQFWERTDKLAAYRLILFCNYVFYSEIRVSDLFIWLESRGLDHPEERNC